MGISTGKEAVEPWTGSLRKSHSISMFLRTLLGSTLAAEGASAERGTRAHAPSRAHAPELNYRWSHGRAKGKPRLVNLIEFFKETAQRVNRRKPGYNLLGLQASV